MWICMTNTPGEGLKEPGLKIETKILSEEEIKKALDGNEASRKKLYDLSVTTRIQKEADQKWAIRWLDTSMYSINPDWVHQKLGAPNWPNTAPTITQTTQVAEQVQVAMESTIPPKTEWLTQVDLSKAVKNVMDMIPKELKDFFKAIFWPLLWLSKNRTIKEEPINIPSLKTDWKKILDSYWIKAYKWKVNWTAELRFGNEAKLKWTKVEKPDTAMMPGNKPVEKEITIKEGKVIIQEGAEVASVSEEKTWNVKLEIKNKDGSVETYILTDAKKVEKPA